MLKVQHVVYAGLDGLVVGKSAAQPALVYVPHPATVGLALHHFLGLALRSYEQHLAAIGHQLGHCPAGVVDLAQGLLQIDYVDAIALGEDVPLHLRVPTARLVAEVHSCFQQRLHCHRLSVGCNNRLCFRRGGRCFQRRFYRSYHITCLAVKFLDSGESILSNPEQYSASSAGLHQTTDTSG